jgi:hypothetical protein
MFVQWAVTADKKTSDLLDQLKKIPLEDRKRESRISQIVQDLKIKWSSGTKIERLATLGWIEYDSISIFCNMLDQLDQLRQEYSEQVKINGTPPPFKDEYIKDYENAIWFEHNNMKNSK